MLTPPYNLVISLVILWSPTHTIYEYSAWCVVFNMKEQFALFLDIFSWILWKYSFVSFGFLIMIL